MTENSPKSDLKAVLASSLPDRKRKLKIWAIRSVIVVAAAYAVVAMNGPAWLIWAAWAYVALTLGLAFVLSRPGGPDANQ